MTSRANNPQLINPNNDTYSRPTLVQEPARKNTLNHYYSEGQQRAVIDQQRQYDRVTPRIVEQRQVNRPVSYNEQQNGQFRERSKKVKYSFKNTNDASYRDSRIEQTRIETVDYKPVVVPETVVERPVKVEAPVVVRRQTETFRDINAQERELISLRERVRDQDNILSRIRDIARLRKEECERENRTGDFKCINTLIEIYNLSITHTEYSRMTFLETRINNFVQPAPQVRTITVPKPAPRVEIQQPPRIINPQPQPQFRPTFNITPEITPKPSPRPSPAQERNYVPPQPAPVAIERQEVRRPVAPPSTVVERRDESEKYLKQISELRETITRLELQIVTLTEKNKYLEVSQETITTYREEIERLKYQITEFGSRDNQRSQENSQELERLKREIIQLKTKEREYESQLLESQSHIIYLEGMLKNRPEPEPVRQVDSGQHEREIIVLKEQIYSLEKEIQQYYSFRDQIKIKEQELLSKEHLLINRESEIKALQEQIRNKERIILSKESEITALQQDLRSKEQLLLSKESESHTSDRDQTIISKETEIHTLQQQIIVLKEKNAEVLSYLQKAEDYILQLQNQPQPEPVSQPEPSNTLNLQLEQALQQEYKNQQELRNQYELQISNINQEYEVQITGIRNQYDVQIQQFNQIILNLRQEVSNLTAINVQLKQEITVYQTKIEQFNTTINQYEQTINQYKVTIHNHEQQAKTTSKGGVDQEAYDALWLDNGKRVIQIIFLMEEIDRLNLHYNQIREHLVSAENHIRESQAYIRDLELEVKTSTFKTSQSNTYVIKIKELDNRVANLTQDLAYQKQKTSQQKNDLTILEGKYQAVIEEMHITVTRLQTERDQAVNKGGSSEEVRIWEEKFNQQSLELDEVLSHLRNAEEYIKQNGEMWTKATEAYEILPEKLQIIEMLKKDLEITRAQNKELNDRIIQLEKLIEMMENRKSSSQVQAPAASESRVAELEQSLANYKKLYSEAQNKYANAVKEINTLKVSNQKISSSNVSATRTTVISSDQKAKWDSERKQLETEVTQVKNHLIGAESYIRELEEQLANLNKQYETIATERTTKLSDRSHINDSLRKAEQQISQMQKLMPSQHSSSGVRPTLG